MTIQDWGVTFDELEPHYDEFEYLCGTSGQAGNLKGAIQDGGNPFEGPRSRPYPTPPLKQGYGHMLFAEAAQAARLQAVSAAGRQPVAVLHQSARRHARAMHLLRLLRMVRLRQLFQGQPADHDPAGAAAQIEFRRRAPSARSRASISIARARWATGVTYVDASGAEIEQPADLVILCAFQLFNVQLLLLSGHRQALRSAIPAKARSGATSRIRPCRRRSASSTRTNTISIRSSRPARSA